MSATDIRQDLQRRVDAIEGGYEYCLAYAAQGRTTDRDASGAPGELRERLGGMAVALQGLGAVVRDCAAARDPHWPRIGEHFFSALDDDAAKAAGAIGLVLAQQTISSQLVDNLNATIHLRALLTDLFLADEALQGPET